VGDLPLWLGLGELWEVELDGDVVEQERKVVARRGRLLRRVEVWDDAANRAFLEACAAEARRRTDAAPAQTEYADDIAHGAAIAPVAGYMAARLAEVQDGPAGYEQERRRQADWLGANLRLRT
jgi:hypothetical protein